MTAGEGKVRKQPLSGMGRCCARRACKWGGWREQAQEQLRIPPCDRDDTSVGDVRFVGNLIVRADASVRSVRGGVREFGRGSGGSGGFKDAWLRVLCFFWHQT